MVQQAVNRIRTLEDEVRRLSGILRAISIGGTLVPGVVPGGQSLPTPVEGAILFGTGVPDWARLAPPSSGDDYELTFIDGDTAPSWQVRQGDEVFIINMAAAL